MAKESGIAWTKSTFNPWIGCTKVGAGCDHCYAETMDKRAIFDGKTHWGSGVERKRTSQNNWEQVYSWNEKAPRTTFAGRKGFWPVFCASLADVFDNEVDPQWRIDLWKLIKETPNLTWLILTKRIGVANNWIGMYGLPDNVWLGATVVNQEEADRDIPKLLQIPVKVRFLSIEPMLGPVEFSDVTKRSDAVQQLGKKAMSGIDWVIVGGESGTKARPMHPCWARSVRDQCAAAGVPFFFKQHGEYTASLPGHVNREPELWLSIDGRIGDEEEALKGGIWMGMHLLGTKASGYELDKTIYQEFPI